MEIQKSCPNWTPSDFICFKPPSQEQIRYWSFSIGSLLGKMVFALGAASLLNRYKIKDSSYKEGCIYVSAMIIEQLAENSIRKKICSAFKEQKILTNESTVPIIETVKPLRPSSSFIKTAFLVSATATIALMIQYYHTKNSDRPSSAKRPS